MLNRLKTYIEWAFWVGLVFFAVYPVCNWISSRRDAFDLYLETELLIPFIPGFIWIYLSMYVLFLAPPLFLSVNQLRMLGRSLVGATLVSGLLFLLLPSRLGFSRTTPDEVPYAVIYSKLFTVDLPHNMVPSLHVVFSAMIIMFIAYAAESIVFRFCCFAWLLLLCLSTLFVHQHHLLDVISGLALALIGYRFVSRESHHA
jgi:membrane-associated phospholipid phosphatase